MCQKVVPKKYFFLTKSLNYQLALCSCSALPGECAVRLFRPVVLPPSVSLWLTHFNYWCKWTESVWKENIAVLILKAMRQQMFQHVASVPTPAWTHSAADVVPLGASSTNQKIGSPIPRFLGKVLSPKVLLIAVPLVCEWGIPYDGQFGTLCDSPHYLCVNGWTWPVV